MIRSIPSLALTTALALAHTPAGHADCPSIDFENFAPGTVATNLVPGVTITCTPGSCGGGPVAEVYELTGGVDGTTNVISPREGCPGFSPDGLLLTFDENHDRVTFRLGTGNGAGADVLVRWFNEFGTTLGNRLYTTSNTGLLVEIEAGAAIIRTVEVKHVGDFFECIDDLSFGGDDTPPAVEITGPAFGACVCGDDIVGITGSVADVDGVYGCDVAEYRAAVDASGTPWTQFGQACGAFTGTLHSWNTTGVPEGDYYVRITGENECGLTESAVTVVHVSRFVDQLEIFNPTGPICGVAEIGGSAKDGCGISWTLSQRPISGGPYTEIATGGQTTCTLTDWDTTTVPDGDYELRMVGTNSCGNSVAITQIFTVDNANCDSADINGDGFVNVVDLLILLGAWSP